MGLVNSLKANVRIFSAGARTLRALNHGKKVTIGQKDLLESGFTFRPLALDVNKKSLSLILHGNFANEVVNIHSISLKEKNLNFWQRLSAISELNRVIKDVSIKARSLDESVKELKFFQIVTV